MTLTVIEREIAAYRRDFLNAVRLPSAFGARLAGTAARKFMWWTDAAGRQHTLTLGTYSSRARQVWDVGARRSVDYPLVLRVHLDRLSFRRPWSDEEILPPEAGGLELSLLADEVLPCVPALVSRILGGNVLPLPVDVTTPGCWPTGDYLWSKRAASAYDVVCRLEQRLREHRTLTARFAALSAAPMPVPTQPEARA